MNLRSLLVGLGAATLLGACANLQPAQVPNYELIAGVPNDFYLVTGGKLNSEQDFLRDHWARVEQAFNESGIGEELMGLMLSDAPPEAVEIGTGIYETISELVMAVDWSALQNEVVFGQRLGKPVYSDSSFYMGPPDMVFLFKVDAETGPGLFDHLVALERGILDQIQNLSGLQINLETIEASGIDFTVLDFQKISSEAPAIPISVGLSDGAVVVTVGPGVRGQVAALLSGEGPSIASSPRFKAAFQGLPRAENGFSYIDMPNLRANTESIFGAVSSFIDTQVRIDTESMESNQSMDERAMVADITEQVMDLVLEGMSLMEYAATVSHTEGYSVFTEARLALADSAKENRFYPMIATHRSVENFAQYLPASTRSYSVKGGTDLNAIYDFGRELVRDFGPKGVEALDLWEDFQKETGFSIRRDVFDWIDGETVAANFSLEGEDAWVTRIRVKDEAMAKEKLGMGLSILPTLFELATEEIPMVGMIGLTVKPTRDSRFQGFTEIKMGMLQQTIMCGVKDGWMVFASSGDALVLTEEVAMGTAPSLLENKALMAHAVTFKGSVQAASFRDYSTVASGVSEGLMRLTMIGGMATGMIQDPKIHEVAKTALGLLGDLAPVIQEIDFFRSGSSVMNFTGEAWHKKSVVNFTGPSEGL